MEQTHQYPGHPGQSEPWEGMQAFPALAIKSQILAHRRLSNKLASSDISVRLLLMQWQA